MTEKEAISIIEDVWPSCGERTKYSEGELCEAFDMAVKALEEVQARKNIIESYNREFGGRIWGI